MCPSSDWSFDESIDEQNSRAAEAREEDRRKADAEHEEKNKGGFLFFRPFSEWGKGVEEEKKSDNDDDGSGKSGSWTGFGRMSNDAGM